eukprot:3211796-Ditylum_brightwellii.AAC.1
MVKHNPQAVHSAFSRSLQHEWSYLQWVIANDPAHYDKLNKIIWEELILSLLDVDVVNNTLLPLFFLLMKFTGSGILHPTTEVSLNHVTSINSTIHLKEAILQNHPFNSADHRKCMDSGREVGQKSKAEKYESVLIVVTQPMSPDIECTIHCSQECGQLLNLLPQYCNNTVLSEQEFYNNLLFHNRCTLANLPKHCDGCRKKFTLIHTLECKSGGLIIVQQNEVQYKLAQIGSQTYTKSSISNKPYVNTNWGVR